MRMKKPAVALATAALMTLAACGGGSENENECDGPPDHCPGCHDKAAAVKDAELEGFLDHLALLVAHAFRQLACSLNDYRCMSG